MDRRGPTSSSPLGSPDQLHLPMGVEPEYLTLAEAARLTMFSVEFFKKALQRGYLRAYRPVGTTRGNRRILRADLDAFMRGEVYQPLLAQPPARRDSSRRPRAA